MPKPSFIGLDTQYLTAKGELRQRIHMDGAASPLAASIALETTRELLPHYSNTHSYVHTSAQISTRALNWAHHQVLSTLHARQEDYTAIFTGAGTTAGINRLARGLAGARPDRKVVLVSA
ncbi:MAG: aminotransferase class V-fold PLP-dependent enzyme, partial [Gammaproteobacteria bacterium]|nr:aminotransferase class V-fold PLP-dependent enzyme [Gammaproteobacteria bacterium]